MCLCLSVKLKGVSRIHPVRVRRKGIWLVTLPSEGTVLKADMRLCVFLQLREQA